jgi:hypothetical protein
MTEKRRYREEEIRQIFFGAGHAAILRELVTGDRSMVLVEANEFLP